jgi:hypothetical protein
MNYAHEFMFSFSKYLPSAAIYFCQLSGSFWIVAVKSSSDSCWWRWDLKNKMNVRIAFLRKGTIVYKVWPKVFEGGEFKPMSDFSRFLNSRITLFDVSWLNNVSLSTQPNFRFRIVLSEAHEAEALLLIKYFSTSFRSIFISQKL